MKLQKRNQKLRQRGSSVFELMLVVGVASFFGSTIVPLLGTSSEFDKRLQQMMHDKMEEHLIEGYAAGLGANPDSLEDAY